MKSQKRQESVRRVVIGEQTNARTRAKFHCPTGVARLIALVNSIPPTMPLPHIEEIKNSIGAGFKATWHQVNQVDEIVREKLEGVPDDYFKDIVGIAADDVEYRLEKYMRFRKIRKTLHELAQLAPKRDKERGHHINAITHGEPRGAGFVVESWRIVTPDESAAFPITTHLKVVTQQEVSNHNQDRTQQQNTAYRPNELLSENESTFWREMSYYDREFPQDPSGGMLQWQWPAISLEIDETGNFALQQKHWLLDLIGVQADRLRECLICQRIFWARQCNTEACDVRCQNTLRQRKLRKSGPQYQAARKQKNARAKKAEKRTK